MSGRLSSSQDASAGQFALDLRASDAAGEPERQGPAEDAAVQAYRWRLQLVVAEAAMMSGLVAVAGFMLGHSLIAILRATVAVSGACLASGLLLLSLSSSLGRVARRARGEIRS